MACTATKGCTKRKTDGVPHCFLENGFLIFLEIEWGKRLLADPDRAQHLLKGAFVTLELTLRSDENNEQQALGALQGDQPVGFTAPTCGGRVVREIRRKRGVSIDTNTFVVADHAHVLVCLAE